MQLEDLGLGPLARAAALELLTEFGPDVIMFSRGYSDLRAQARAMAGNVLRNKEWIKQTYTRKERPSYAIACLLQDVVYRNSEINDRMAITDYLHAALLAIPNGHEISFHCRTTVDGEPAAEAFDLVPLEDDLGIATAMGFKVKDKIRRGLPDLDTFLTREGGLPIWHVQFSRRQVEV